MTSPHLAQGNPSEQPNYPETDNTVGVTQLFGPPPTADEAFPAAMRAVPPPPAPEPGAHPPEQPRLSEPVPAVAPPPRRRRRAALLAGTAAVALVGTGGVAAYATAHKTVTLDVDGKVTRVETFQGDVADLLVDEGFEITDRDAVTPGPDAALREGGTVVVRYGHQVTVRADGERRTVWVTALDADQALAGLSEDADEVVLVPSRPDGRPTLPMRLDADSPVDLVVGGKAQRVADGATSLSDLLADHDVRVDADDRITVERGLPSSPGAPTLSVVVKQVQTSIDETASSIPFETVTATDPDRFEDLDPYVASEGAPGKRVTSWDVTTIDGKVVDREKLNTWVEHEPVDRVIMYGSKARPEPKPDPKPKPKPDPEPTSEPKPDHKSEKKPDPKPEPEPKKKSAEEPEARTVSTAGVWAELAACESGGDPTTNTGNGYYGLYQFSQPTWVAMGGSGLPSEASGAEQTTRAQMLQQRSGWGQWPGCAAALGLY